jgi:hypothetical protein
MKTKIIAFTSRSTSVRVVRQLTPVLACCSAFGLLAGCASAPDSHVVSAPPPPAPTRSVTTTTTTTTPDTVPAVVTGNPANVTYSTTTSGGNPANVTYATTTSGGSTAIVTEAPPALQSEVVLVQPSPQDVWIAGYWTWRDTGYHWRAGHWELPPNSSSVWVAPTCQRQGTGYKYTDGYWN